MTKFITTSACILLITSVLLSCKNNNKLPDPLEAGWQGQSVCEVLEDTKELRVLKCIFPPNVGHEMHYHNPHVGYTVKGSAFRISNEEGTREVDVPTGYTFSNDEITEHQVLNIGDSTAVFLIMEYK